MLLLPQQPHHIKHHHVSTLVTGSRQILKSTRTPLKNTVTYGKCKMDLHADTIVAGSNCVVLNYIGK